MKNNLQIKAFTLVEIIISVTIFSLIMVSIISIFIISSDTSLKTDINRAMHENVKSVIWEIAEEVRKEWITWVSIDAIDSCDFSDTWYYKKWTKLCTESWKSYYLAKEISWVFSRVESNQCENLEDRCFIVMNWEPLTNSLVSVKSLDFYVSEESVNKATINVTFQPSVKVWVKSDLIKNNILNLQTTISQRPF